MPFVIDSNALIDPRTMMVVLEHTALTDPTMVSTLRLHTSTLHALSYSARLQFQARYIVTPATS